MNERWKGWVEREELTFTVLCFLTALVLMSGRAVTTLMCYRKSYKNQLTWIAVLFIFSTMKGERQKLEVKVMCLQLNAGHCFTSLINTKIIHLKCNLIKQKGL